MLTEIPMTSGRSKVTGEVKLFQYAGLFHSARTGDVQYDIALELNGKTIANMSVKMPFYNSV